jgi:hypothetical protein
MTNVSDPEGTVIPLIRVKLDFAPKMLSAADDDDADVVVVVVVVIFVDFDADVEAADVLGGGLV